MDGLKSEVGVPGGLARHAPTAGNENEIEALYHSFTCIKKSNIPFFFLKKLSVTSLLNYIFFGISP